jgi:predicted transcriptional regulator
MGKQVHLDLKRPVLIQLLEAWNITYVDFSRMLGINRQTLFQYRKGTRQFTLNTQQIKILNKMLAEVGLSFADLPDNWIIENIEST